MRESLHITLGACRYADYKAGDLVELSPLGWGHGLAEYYAYTFGRVLKFEKGVLTVQREGMERAQEYHPCFWRKITYKELEVLRKLEREEHIDHVAGSHDCL